MFCGVHEPDLDIHSVNGRADCSRFHQTGLEHTFSVAPMVELMFWNWRYVSHCERLV
jgi:hypothetical protein